MDGSGGIKPSLLPVSEAVSVPVAEGAVKGGWVGSAARAVPPGSR